MGSGLRLVNDAYQINKSQTLSLYASFSEKNTQTSHSISMPLYSQKSNLLTQTYLLRDCHIFILLSDLNIKLKIMARNSYITNFFS